MASDAELRGIVLAAAYELRRANTGWVPISTETFSGIAPLNSNVVATICEHLKQADLIDWRPSSRGPTAGMARISAHGVDVVEGASRSRINIVLPERLRSTSTPQGALSGTFDAGTFDAVDAAPVGPSPHAVQISESIRAEDRASATITPSKHVTDLHREMLSGVGTLEAIVAAMRTPAVAGIGHNQPPEPIEGVSFGENEWGEIETAARTLKVQQVSPNDPTDARSAADVLRAIGEVLWKGLVRAGAYGTDKLDLFVTEASKSAGKEVGKRLPQMFLWWPLVSTLYAVSHAAHVWLAALPH